MSIEVTNEKSEDLIQENLLELKNQLNKPGQMMFLRESTDKQYKIYRYELVQGGNKGGIKNKFISQIGPWVEGTQFTDAIGNETDKDRFNTGEVIYLRVPKNKERINTPGEFNFLKKVKDKQNKNWKIYSYTLLYGGNVEGIEQKYHNKIGPYNQYLLPGRNFCDKDGNVIMIKGGWFEKGETVYIRVPDRDVVDTLPEMTMNEIKNLSDADVIKIFDSFNEFSGSDANPHRGSMYLHADKNGDYIIINGKKTYILNGESIDKKIIDKKIGVCLHFHEGYMYRLDIGMPNGENFDGIIYDGNHIERGAMKWEDLWQIY